MLKKIFKSDYPEEEINRLAFPAIVASIAEPLISICDSAILSQYSDTNSVSVGAANLGSSFFLSIIWIFSQTRTAMSSVMSKYFGAGNIEAVRKLVPQVILMNFFLGFIFLLLTNSFATELFSMYNAEGELLTSAVDYYSIRSIGLPLTLSTVLIFGVFRGVQNTLWAMMISITGTITNLLLDYAFIGGIEGWIEPMGVKGAAYASLTSQAIMFVLAIVFLFRKTNFNLNFFGKIHPEVKNLMKHTGNLIIRSIAVQTAYFFSNRVAASYGEHHITVQGIFFNIWLFSAFFIEGYCSAGNAQAGKLAGENNYEKLWKLSLFMVRRTVLISFGLMLFFFVFYFVLGKLFLKNEYELQLFYQAFWLVILVQPIMAVAFSYDEMLKGLGRMAFLRNTLIIASLIGFVPMVHFLDTFQLHLFAVWIAFIFWMSIRAFRMRMYFNRNFRT